MAPTPPGPLTRLSRDTTALDPSRQRGRATPVALAHADRVPLVGLLAKTVSLTGQVHLNGQEYGYICRADTVAERVIADGLIDRGEVATLAGADGRLDVTDLVGAGFERADARTLAATVAARGGPTAAPIGVAFAAGHAALAQTSRQVLALLDDIGHSFADVSDPAAFKTALAEMETNARARFGNASVVTGLVVGLAEKLAGYGQVILDALKHDTGRFVTTMLAFAVAEQIPGINVGLNAYFLYSCSESLLQDLKAVVAAAGSGSDFGTGLAIGRALPDVAVTAVIGRGFVRSSRASFNLGKTAVGGVSGQVRHGAAHWVDQLQRTSMKKVAVGIRGKLRVVSLQGKGTLSQRAAGAAEEFVGTFISNATSAAADGRLKIATYISRSRTATTGAVKASVARHVTGTQDR